MFLELINNFFASTGYVALTWQAIVMLGIACILLYLAIVKQYEPLLLLPIAFGMLLANIPLAGLMDYPVYEVG
ncbi:sodium ion-translocating decarboxylase subunit beta, partial [Wukongibacter baidiensis]